MLSSNPVEPPVPVGIFQAENEQDKPRAQADWERYMRQKACQQGLNGCNLAGMQPLRPVPPAPSNPPQPPIEQALSAAPASNLRPAAAPGFIRWAWNGLWTVVQWPFRRCLGSRVPRVPSVPLPPPTASLGNLEPNMIGQILMDLIKTDPGAAFRFSATSRAHRAVFKRLPVVQSGALQAISPQSPADLRVRLWGPAEFNVRFLHLDNRFQLDDYTLNALFRHYPNLETISSTRFLLNGFSRNYADAVSLLRKTLLHCPSVSVADLGFLARSYPFGSERPGAIDFSECSHLTPEHLKALVGSYVPEYRTWSINLSRFSGLTPEHLKALVHTQGDVPIVSLQLVSCPGLTPQHLEVLAHYPKLARLNLAGCPGLTPQHFRELVNCRQLAMLGLSSCQYLTPEHLAVLAGCQALRILELINCQGITPEHIAVLGRYPKLRRLNLAGCRGLMPDHFRALGGCRHLTRLTLSYCPDVTLENLKILLTHCPHLEELNLRDCPNIKPSDIAMLKTFPNCPSGIFNDYRCDDSFCREDYRRLFNVYEGPSAAAWATGSSTTPVYQELRRIMLEVMEARFRALSPDVRRAFREAQQQASMKEGRIHRWDVGGFMVESLRIIREQFEQEVGRIAEPYTEGSVLSNSEFQDIVDNIYEYQILDAFPADPDVRYEPIAYVPMVEASPTLPMDTGLEPGIPAATLQEPPAAPPPAEPTEARPMAPAEAAPEAHPVAPATAPEIVADAVRRNMAQLSPDVRQAIHTYFGSSSGGDAVAYHNLINALERTVPIRIRQELGRDAEILQPGNPQLHQMIEAHIREAFREDR